jgi:phosphoenolpyruvate---glycerone phosphotransferase subunit DhaL
MPDTLNKTIFAAMIDAANVTVNENLDLLGQLDAATGDGDHGIAIKKTIGAAKTAVTGEGTFAEILTAVGWAVMSEGVGSAGPLLGAFFMGMGENCPAEELDAAQTAALFAAGLAGMQEHSKALVGDKTMMDAIIPAIESMQGKDDIATLLNDASAAAAAGAEATVDMVAKYGRAKNLGERSKGHMDAGAKSQSLIFAAYAKAFGEA